MNFTKFLWPCFRFLKSLSVIALAYAWSGALSAAPQGKEGDGGDITGLDIKAEGKILLEFVLGLPESTQPFSDDQIAELKGILGKDVEFHFTNEPTRDKQSGEKKDAVTVLESGKKVVYFQEQSVREALGKDVEPRSERFLRLVYHELFNVTNSVDDSGNQFSASLGTLIFPHRLSIHDQWRAHFALGNLAFQTCNRISGRMPFQTIHVGYQVDQQRLISDKISLQAIWDKTYRFQFDVGDKISTSAVKVDAIDAEKLGMTFHMNPSAFDEAWGTLKVKIQPLGRAAVAEVNLQGDFDEEFTASFLCNGYPFSGIKL